MNWLWTYQETVQSCHDTFRQVIAFMDEYKDFTFLQSQASTYVAVEAYDPALFARIRARVQEGRWELAGGMYSEGDTNLSGGEALARSFLLGQRYFLDRFGRTATVGWLPDNFGHASQLPQILRLAGCEFFYFHRCQPHFGTFWWEGPDGSRVLCYSNDNYNGKVTAGVAANIERIVPEKRRLLEVCGVGDHGGGPTRADIEHAQSLNATPRFPSVAWTSAERFFRDSAAESVGRPVHRGEMQYIFEGCYTTIARIKEGNRRCEAALYTAEWLACLRRLAGDAYPAEDLRRAWEIVTFNQFHDILCGSAIHESNADSAADYKWALARAESVSGHALRRLADQVAFDRSLGQPLVVANPHPRPVTSLVEAEVFTHDPPVTVSRLSFWSEFYDGNRIGAEPGVLPTVCLRDHAGRAIPAQVVWGKDFPPGKRWRVLFKAEDLPAGGHRAYYLDAAKPGDCVLPLEEQQGRFDTEHLRVAFDMATGEIASLKDKRSGVEYAARCGGLNRLRILCEKPHGMSGWNIGPISKTEDVTDVVSVSVVERGPVRACVETVKRWGRSKFIQRTYIYRSYPRVDFELEVHWFEQGNAQVDAPMLQAVFPLRLKNPRFDCQTPFDVVSRPSTGQEVPAQQWVDVSDGKAGLALLNRTKYGHALKAAELTLTLLRSSYDPDIYPDQGLHRIAYSLFPHTGDWRNGVWNEGELFNVPPLAAEPPSFAWREGPATLPQETTGAVLEPGTVALSGIKESEDGRELVVRLVEVRGEAVTATLRLPARIRAARHLDLIERPLAGAPAVELVGGGIRVSLAPHQIVSVGLDVEQL
jgi:alpha-mannosidase